MSDTDQNQSSPDTSNDSPEAKLNAQINAAVTGHLKRAMAKQTDDIKALIAEAIKSSLPAAPPPPQLEEPKDNKGKVDPAFLAMKAQFEELQRNLTAEREARQKVETKQREDRAYADLKDVLKAKVRPEMLDFLAQNLFYASKRVEIDNEGNPLFKARVSPGAGMPEEDVLLPLNEGIQTYLSSKEASVFLPAPTPQAAPPRGARMPVAAPQQKNVGANGLPAYDKPANSDEEKVRRAMETERALAEHMRNRNPF